MATLAAEGKPVPMVAREERPWRSVAQAMGETGGASLVGGLLSLFAVKMVAVMAGPAAIAVLATLQQLRAAAVTAATLNGSTAVVQGAHALTGIERREFLRTALCLIAGATVVLVLVLVAMPGWVSEFAGLDARRAGLLRLLAVPLMLGAVYVFLAAMLNAVRAIRSIALVQVAAPGALAVLAWPVARSLPGGSEVWLVAWLAASGLAAALAATVLLRPHRAVLIQWFRGAGGWWSWSAVQRFLKISGALFVSGLVYSGAVIAVRAGILRTEGLETAGHFDAAWAISMNQATLVLASLQTVYLPALAQPSEPGERAAHIKRVLVLSTAGAAVLLAALIAMKPQVITLFYSAEFSDSGRYLRWTLAGDYLKISSWILSVPLVAAADMRMFLAADLGAYAAFLGIWLLLTGWLPAADSAAMAFAGMYAVHLSICAARLWWTRVFRPDRNTIVSWLAGLALVAGASAIFWGQT